MEGQFEIIMEAACELCHYPYVVADQEKLDALCENCPVERILKECKT